MGVHWGLFETEDVASSKLTDKSHGVGFGKL